MSRLRFRISMSLDGFVAGPCQSVKHPLGIDGGRLHHWALPLAAFRRRLGLEGGVVDESTPIIEEAFTNVGATIMGRNMFGGHPGPWKAENPWNGWWGDNPPFHHPVFVLTHFPRETIRLDGETSFTFVTDGIESALDQARRAAGDLDVSLGGGAGAARQYLLAGLVDDMLISLAPIFLGSGERLFDGLGGSLSGFELTRTITAPKATHFTFIKR